MVIWGFYPKGSSLIKQVKILDNNNNNNNHHHQPEKINKKKNKLLKVLKANKY